MVMNGEVTQMIKASRTAGFLVLLLVYIVASLAGIAVFHLLGSWWFYARLFAADVAATLVVWLAGLLLRNASVYDPYWSVAPLVLLPLGAAALGVFNAGLLAAFAAVALWGLRLTAHWANTFVNLKTQDWRYTQLMVERRSLWFLVNLFGIHLFPTVVVFLALAPAFQYAQDFRSLNLLAILGLVVCVSAAVLQYVADAQMRLFRKQPENRGCVNRLGVWKYSRHPNYLGEILMWWGICLMSLSAPGASPLYAVGALVNTLMFVFISVPMMERRQLDHKPEYAAYRAESGMLLPKLPAFRRTGSNSMK